MRKAGHIRKIDPLRSRGCGTSFLPYEMPSERINAQSGITIRATLKAGSSSEPVRQMRP